MHVCTRQGVELWVILKYLIFFPQYLAAFANLAEWKSKWEKQQENENNSEPKDRSTSDLSPEEAAMRIMGKKDRYSTETRTR